MRIKAEFYGSFREYGKELVLMLPEGATVNYVIAEIGRVVPALRERIESSETMIVVVNGKRVEKEHRLKEGDVVKFFSSVLGG